MIVKAISLDFPIRFNPLPTFAVFTCFPPISENPACILLCKRLVIAQLVLRVFPVSTNALVLTFLPLQFKVTCIYTFFALSFIWLICSLQLFTFSAVLSSFVFRGVPFTLPPRNPLFPLKKTCPHPRFRHP